MANNFNVDFDESISFDGVMVKIVDVPETYEVRRICNQCHGSGVLPYHAPPSSPSSVQCYRCNGNGYFVLGTAVEA